MDLATVAMAGLLPKLVELLKEEYKLQEGVKKDVESLSRELRSTHAAICKVAEAVPGDLLDDQVRLWANDARELSYDMEDVVDNFLVHAEGSVLASRTETLEELMKKMMAVFEKGKTLPPIASAIRGIRDQVLDVVAHPNPAGTTDIVESCQLQALCKDQKELVGIEGARDEVVRRLTDGDDKNQLKILSIFGFGGLGKTTLAKAVYDCLHVQYDYGAFVHVGRSSSTKEVFKDILIELRKYNEEASLLDESQLIEKLRGLLENKSLIGVLGNLTSLQELSLGHVSECPNFMEDLGKLTELRKLRIAIQELDDTSRRSLAESMCNLQKIQVLNLRHGFGISSTAGSRDGYVPPHGLRDLRIRMIWSSGLPPWINSSLLHGLTHLKVELNSLETADLEILGRLPELVMLRLWTLRGNVCFPAAAGGALFPKLRYCKMDLPLKFPPGAMPCLESIDFRLDLLCLKDEDFDFDELSSLENVRCLERVIVWIYSMEAHERDFVKADAAARHAVHIHPNRPILKIDCDYEYDISDSDDDGSDPDERDQEMDDEDEEEEDMRARRVRRRSI